MFRGVCQGKFLTRLPIAIAIVICLFLVTLVSGSTEKELRPQRVAGAKARPELLFVQAAVVLDVYTAQRFPSGSRIARLASDSKQPVDLTPEFFAAADPQVDFTGAKVLFSAQRIAGEKWQIWEMNADGSNKRQITSCTEDCVRPAYLPAEEIIFTVAKLNKGSQQTYLAVSKIDGSQMHPITFGPGNFWLETVLRDGRVLASASSPLQENEAAGKTRLLYTLRPDGAALESFRCDHQPSVKRGDAAELEDGSVVFVKRGNTRDAAGGMAEVRRGDPGETPLSHSAGKYLSPRWLSGDRLVVSRAVATQGSSPAKFNLYSFDLTKQVNGELIYSDAKLSSIQAVPLIANPVPKHFWSTLNPDAKSGYFISLNSYDSLEGVRGRLVAEIARVRVISMRSDGKERSLGEAPVEKDGSFYVEVLANQPVRFELLDDKGQTIVAERSWIWTRPGEQHGCHGCHGDKALAPENRWPLTLRRFDTPTALLEKENAAETAHTN